MNPAHDVGGNLYEPGRTILDLHQGEDFFCKKRMEENNLQDA